MVLKGNNSSGEFYSVALTNHYQQADTGVTLTAMSVSACDTFILIGPMPQTLGICCNLNPLLCI